MSLPKSADGSLQVGFNEPKPTYSIQEPVVGPSGGGPSGQNKAMVSVLNPSGSGKVLRLRAMRVQPESSSGTGVIILMELRAITAHSGGSAATIHKRDSTNAAPGAESKTEPSSVTGSTNIHTFIFQANTAQGLHEHLFGSWADSHQPIVLREGEGVVVHQVTSNGGTFHIELVWTEE